MTRSEKNQKDLLAMAAGTLPSSEQARVQALIASDTECRQYWESLQKLSKTLANAQHQADQELPLGFHSRLMNRLDRESAPRSAEIRGGLAGYLSSMAKPLAAIAVILIVAAGMKLTIPQRSTAPKPNTQSGMTQTHTLQIEATSWAVLRSASSDSNPTLASVSSKKTPSDYPTMGWASRERWIKEYDL